MTSINELKSAANNQLAQDMSVICAQLGIGNFESLPQVMKRITDLMALAGGKTQELALLSGIEVAAKELLKGKTPAIHDVASGQLRAELQQALDELDKQRVLWGYITTNVDLESENSIANFLLDAIRYRGLRDHRNQLHEDDPCVSDSSFTTYFGKDLDKVADALCRRAIQLNAVKE